MGAIDTSLFTGNINYVSIPEGEASFWQIPLDQVSLGQSTVQAGETLAAIDTGTTLIAGPFDVVDQLYQGVPNLQVGSGSEQGMYFFPCAQTITASLTFGGVSYSLNQDDVGIPVGQGLCVGAFFVEQFAQQSTNGKKRQYTQTETPSWIVGDSFLKNVYAVFRSNPAAVGFATLSNPQGLTTLTAGLSLTQGGTVAPGIATIVPQSQPEVSYTTITTHDRLFGTVTAIIPVETGVFGSSAVPALGGGGRWWGLVVGMGLGGWFLLV